MGLAAGCLRLPAPACGGARHALAAAHQAPCGALLQPAKTPSAATPAALQVWQGRLALDFAQLCDHAHAHAGTHLRCTLAAAAGLLSARCSAAPPSAHPPSTRLPNTPPRRWPATLKSTLFDSTARTRKTSGGPPSTTSPPSRRRPPTPAPRAAAPPGRGCPSPAQTPRWRRWWAAWRPPRSPRSRCLGCTTWRGTWRATTTSWGACRGCRASSARPQGCAAGRPDGRPSALPRALVQCTLC